MLEIKSKVVVWKQSKRFDQETHWRVCVITWRFNSNLKTKDSKNNSKKWTIQIITLKPIWVKQKHCELIYKQYNQVLGKKFKISLHILDVFNLFFWTIRSKISCTLNVLSGQSTRKRNKTDLGERNP